jgi:ABC-type branched-subunit amino acid transport system ATPase component
VAQPDPVLEVQDVAHSFGGVQAVRGVSLHVNPGSFVGLIGPNGAGKTTLLDCISGVIHNYRGSIRFGGRNVTGWRMDRIASLGLVRTFQASRIFGRMSVLSNLMTGPRRQRGEALAAALAGGWQAEDDAHLAKARGLLSRVSMEP